MKRRKNIDEEKRKEESAPLFRITEEKSIFLFFIPELFADRRSKTNKISTNIFKNYIKNIKSEFHPFELTDHQDFWEHVWFYYLTFKTPMEAHHCQNMDLVLKSYFRPLKEDLFIIFLLKRASNCSKIVGFSH